VGQDWDTERLRDKDSRKTQGNKAHSEKLSWEAELRTADRCPVLPAEQLAGDRALPLHWTQRVGHGRS